MPFRDEPDDEESPGPPLHPDDRLWRHPSELGAARRQAPDPDGGSSRPTPAVVVTDGHDPAGSVGHPRAWTVATASLLVGVAITLAALSVTGTFDEEPVRTVVEQVQVDVPADAVGEAAVAARVGGALVLVHAEHDGTTTVASGVVFRSDGHLLTTADAVAEAERVTVTTAEGEILPATVVGVDGPNDVAVLDVDRDGLPVAVLGSVADLDPGEEAMTVERELDASGPSVSAGRVHALGLEIDTVDGGTLHDMIQAALEVAPRAAGAVLCTPDGAVLGLITTRDAEADDPGLTATSTTDAGTASDPVPVTDDGGMTTLYATPIDYATQLADEIIETGTVQHTWMGVVGDDLPLDEGALLGRSGALMTRVVPDGPADRAGLREGDVVLAVDGVQITSMSSLVVALRDHRPEDVVTVTYAREGAHHDAEVTLTSRA